MKRETFTSATPVNLTLHGDLELLIDEAFEGDADLKRRVAIADATDRGGLAVLKNAIKNRRVQLDPGLQYVLESLEKDQAYFEGKQTDLKNIYPRPKGRFQVQITLEHNLYTKTFPTLAEAQKYRDRMLLLSQALDRD